MKRYELVVNSISEFAPIVTFVVAVELSGFMQAVALLALVSVLVVILEWKVSRRIPKFGLLASGIILFFAGLSLLTGSEFFIILKDTLYAFFFGMALFIGLYFNQLYLKMLFGDFFAMTERGWRILTFRWVLWFMLLALSNEVARAMLVPESWVYYKLIAVFCTWIFGFYQFTLSRRERSSEANEWGLRVRA
jgi:intracellular septation protein